MAILRLTLSIEHTGSGTLDLPETLSASTTEFVWMDYTLATGSIDQGIPQSFTTGITTVSHFVLTSDQAISWKQSVTDEAHSMTANGLALLWGTSITNMLITNSSGVTATIRIGVAGV